MCSITEFALYNTHFATTKVMQYMTYATDTHPQLYSRHAFTTDLTLQVNISPLP